MPEAGALTVSACGAAYLVASGEDGVVGVCTTVNSEGVYCGGGSDGSGSCVSRGYCTSLTSLPSTVDAVGVRFVAGVSPAKLSAHEPIEPSLCASAAADLDLSEVRG